MVQITVFVATLNGPGAPPPFLLAGQPLSSYLYGPMTPAGPAIQIALDFSQYNALPPVGVNVSQSQLNTALAQLLPPAAPGSVPPVGLILAGRYSSYPTAEGFMFDTMAMPGFPFGARQGCALFLDAIAAMVGNPAAALERLTFQAIHELGHALNLWHVLPFQAGPNFMTAPPPNNIIGAWNFIPAQANYVSHAVDPMTFAYVLPGGSSFGERGPIGPTGVDMPYAAKVPRSALKFKIALSHRKFYAGEPVELDLEIALAKNAGSSKLAIPDEVDPGHSRLKIWITSPKGERRLYRSSVHHCGSGAGVHISRTKPFQRDISVFWSADGFTFKEPGKYVLEATYQLSPKHLLKSNKVSCDVLPVPVTAQRWMTALRQPEAVSFLHLKDSIPGKKLDAGLSGHAARDPRSPTAAIIRYALGRSFAKAIAAGTRVSSRDRDRGKAHLKAVASMRVLGAQRRRKARQSLETLSLATRASTSDR